MRSLNKKIKNFLKRIKEFLNIKVSAVVYSLTDLLIMMSIAVLGSYMVYFRIIPYFYGKITAMSFVLLEDLENPQPLEEKTFWYTAKISSDNGKKKIEITFSNISPKNFARYLEKTFKENGFNITESTNKKITVISEE